MATSLNLENTEQDAIRKIEDLFASQVCTYKFTVLMENKRIIIRNCEPPTTEKQLYELSKELRPLCKFKFGGQKVCF